MSGCWRTTFSLITAEPHRAVQCIETLRSQLCEERRCAGRAYWTIAAANDCLIKLLPEPATPRAGIQQPIAYKVAAVVIECRNPEPLVDAVKMIIDIVERCQGIQIKPDTG